MMLSVEEKAYCRGLEALRRKDYAAAAAEFELCGERRTASPGFAIAAEATRLLAYVGEERRRMNEIDHIVKETPGHGKETIIRGQGLQEAPGQHLPGLQR
jgi:hypothetical protein